MTERDIINELRATKGYDIKDNTVGYAETERLIRNVTEIVKARGIIPLVMPPLPDYRTIRKQKGLTLKDVEKATGMHNGYLSQLESGKIKSPSYDVVRKLSNYYNEV